MGIRAFVAIELSERVRRGLADLLEELKGSGADAKWVEPKNLHLTVKFLGQVGEGDVGRVCGIMDEAVAGAAPFRLRIAGAGSFPGGRRPRVVWVGAHGATRDLEAIFRRLEEGLAAVGVEPDGRPFVSHVTLGRLRSPRGADRLAERIARSAERDFGEITVEALTLFQSDLSPKGPTYTPLYHASLGRQPDVGQPPPAAQNGGGGHGTI
jgi:2'-5' RNA ligase